MTSPAQLAGYDADGLGYKTFRPDAVVIPADADELVSLLQSAERIGAPICMRGAGTSLSGGPVAAQGGVVVHTSALRKVRQISTAGLWCEVESGVALNSLDAALKPHGLFYPPDPSSGPVCTLGGNVAMNAGGARCFRYGVTSNYVLGLEVVMLDGRVHRFGGPAGGRGEWREDWKRLMVGSEGTLGAFTRFWLRVLPRPEKFWTFRATYPDLQTVERAIHQLVAHTSFPTAIELMDPRCVAMVENSPMAVGLPRDAFMLLTEIDGPTALVDSRVAAVAEILRGAGSQDVVYSDDEAQRQKLWKARKVAGGLMGQISADFVVQDAVIPKLALAELLQLVYDEADAVGIPAVNVFHAGDGNLHPNFLFDSRRPGELEKVEHIGKRFMQRVVAVGGTLSGEHGIGNDKTAYMPMVFGPDTLRLQLAVPAAFNPQHQLNPLKVFNDRRFESVTKQPAARHQVASATASTPTRDPRCFEHFVDPIDGVVCVSAETTIAELRTLAAPHGLRFPLVLAEQATLREQVAASGFAPASSRFGPFCDNILGMNWQLPDGRVVRIGERVAKTTTGYDLFRYLLNSAGPYGRPLDYVVRLRPASEVSGLFWLTGPVDRVREAVPQLLSHCWMHWFDSLDTIITGDDCRMRIGFESQAIEWSLCESYLSSFAKSHELVLHVERGAPMPADGCPDLVLKTTPEHLAALGMEVAQSSADVRVVALGYNGVLHVYLAETNDRADRIRTLAQRLAGQLHAVGGDWHSRHLPPQSPTAHETLWLATLEREFAVR